MDDFVKNLISEVSDAVAHSKKGRVANQVIKKMVKDALKTQQRLAGKSNEQCITAVIEELRSGHTFCEDKTGFYLATEGEVRSPNWVCMHASCRRGFGTTIYFQKHLNESNHFNGKITKKVRELCKVTLSKRGVVKSAVPVCRPNNGLHTAGTVHPTNTRLQIAASVFPSVHGLQDSITNKLSMLKLNSLLSDDLIISSGLHDKIDSEKGEISVVSVEAGRGNDNVDEVGDDPYLIDSICKERIIQYFCSTPSVEVSRKGNVLADYSNAQNFHECALVGQLIGVSKLDNEDQVEEQHQEIYLNTHEPFCLVTVGVQGSGKSHTLATVLEGCLIQFPVKSVCRLEKPMTTLVLHYDESVTSRCEVRYRTIIILLPSTSNY